MLTPLPSDPRLALIKPPYDGHTTALTPPPSLHETLIAPDRLRAWAGEGMFPDGVPLAAPGFAAPGLSLALLAGKAASRCHPAAFRLKIGKPQEHVFVGGMSAALVGSLWWSLFLYGGGAAATKMELLISTMPTHLIIGGLVGEFLKIAWNDPIVEPVIKPALAGAVRLAGLGRVVSALSGNLKQANPRRELFALRMNKMIHEGAAHVNAGERDEIVETARTRALDAEEAMQLKRLDEDIAKSKSLVVELQSQLDAAGMAEDNEPLAYDVENRRDEEISSLKPLFGTAAASAALTAGALWYAFGAPQVTENTRALLAFFSLDVFVGATVGPAYYYVIHQDLWQKIFRPRLVRAAPAVNVVANAVYRGLKGIGRFVARLFGRDMRKPDGDIDVLPGLSKEMGIAPIDRQRGIFDRELQTWKNLRHPLLRHVRRLERKPVLDESDRAKLSAWRDWLDRSEPMIREIESASA